MTSGATRRRLICRGDLPGSDGGIYNPGALMDGRSILLLCRREVDYRFRTELVFPELVVLDRDSLEVVDHRTLLKVGYPPDTRIEDFRCIGFEGMRLAVHSVVQPGRIKPAISRMFGDALQRHDDFDLPIPLNRVEKNWVLFEHHAALHCLYKLDPLTIFVRRADRSWHLVKQEDNGWAGLLAGTLSNSANLIPFDDGYLGFWHTIVGDRYVQGAYLIGRDLSLRYCTGVLLDGGDVQHGYKPGVIYVSALIEYAGRLLAFYGEGDAHTGVAVFDRAELSQELCRAPFQAVESLRILFDGRSLSDAFRAMQTLRNFSESRRHPKIRLFVDQPDMRPTLERLALPNILVQAGDSAERCHGTLAGGTGVLRWYGAAGPHALYGAAGLQAGGSPGPT